MSAAMERGDGWRGQEATMNLQKPGAGKMVLVVEDEPLQRMLIADILYEAGFRSVALPDRAVFFEKPYRPNDIVPVLRHIVH
jgi:CheY-like chemotaxis protein